MTTYFLAPNARYQGRDQTGQPVAGGKLYTYLNQTTTPKATYQDYEGTQPNTNPVILDAKGEANIYWADDDLYTIKLYTSDDQEVETQDNYPVVGTNTTRIISESEANIARNAQFSYWYYGITFSPVVGNGSAVSQDYICDDWYYSRAQTGYTVNVTRGTFNPDQDEVPGNPIYYFQYEATGTVVDTRSRLYQTYSQVQTLADEYVTVTFYAKSPTSRTINVYVSQDFGGGGSSENPVLIKSQTLTDTWAQYTGTVRLDSMSGKTVGTNSQLILEFRFPNDSAGIIQLANIQFQKGETASANFPFQTQETMFQELVNRLQDALPSTGDVKPTFKTTADPGWIFCADNTIGNTGSGATNTGLYTKALFVLLWTVLTNAISPMLTSAGAASTRGASAEADWNAQKRLTLSRTLGRALANAGAGAGLTARALGEWNVGAETVTLSIAEMPAHDHPGSYFNLPSDTVNAPGANGTAYSGNPHADTPVTVASQGGGGAHNNMQPSVFLNFMIKL